MGIAEPFYSMERAVRCSDDARGAPDGRPRARKRIRGRLAGDPPIDPSSALLPLRQTQTGQPDFTFFFFFESAAAAAPPPRPPIRPAVSRAARRKSWSQHAKCSLVQRWCHPIQNLFGACLLVRRIAWSARTSFGTRDAL